MQIPLPHNYKSGKTVKMKILITLRMLCTLIAAMFLLGSCSVEYRARHNHPDDQHHRDMNHGDRDMNHGDHN
jgi:hypothetical protein